MKSISELAVLTPTAAAVAAAAVLAAVLVARRLLRGRAEDALTVVAAVMAQAVVMNGMWRFAGNVLHFSGAERWTLFAFLEICVVACAVRAKRNMRTFGSAGVEGTAVWVLSGLSGFFAALDASSLIEALFRLCTPLVAAWMWHRAIYLGKRERTGKSTHWRVTGERILVRLGLAEPAARETGDVAAHRRIAQLARAAKKVRMLQAAGVTGRRLGWALRRLDARLEAAVEHADLAADPARQQQLIAQLGALGAAESLAKMDARAPWEDAPAAPGLVEELRAELEATQASLLQALGMARPQEALTAGAGAQPAGSPRLVLAAPVPGAAVAGAEGTRPVPFPAAGRHAQPDGRAPADEVTARPAARRDAAPAGRPARRQPARTMTAAGKGSRPAAERQPGDPPVAVIRAAASAEQLAADTGISRWRAQQLRRDGSYAMRDAGVSA